MSYNYSNNASSGEELLAPTVDPIPSLAYLPDWIIPTVIVGVSVLMVFSTGTSIHPSILHTHTHTHTHILSVRQVKNQIKAEASDPPMTGACMMRPTLQRKERPRRFFAE